MKKLLLQIMVLATVVLLIGCDNSNERNEDTTGKMENQDAAEEEPAGPIKLSIPEAAFQFGGHSYYLFENQQTWEDAKKFCESRGGHLAVIDSAEEDAALFEYAKRAVYHDVYFGCYLDSGTYTWVEGDSEYFNISSSEVSAPYLMFSIYQQPDGKWCGGEYEETDMCNFICEWDMEVE